MTRAGSEPSHRDCRCDAVSYAFAARGRQGVLMAVILIVEDEEQLRGWRNLRLKANYAVVANPEKTAASERAR